MINHQLVHMNFTQDRHIQKTLKRYIINPESNLHIPLLYDRPILYFVCHKTTLTKVNDAVNNVHVYMMSESEWQPYDEQAAQDE